MQPQGPVRLQHRDVRVLPRIRQQRRAEQQGRARRLRVGVSVRYFCVLSSSPRQLPDEAVSFLPTAANVRRESSHDVCVVSEVSTLLVLKLGRLLVALQSCFGRGA